MTPYPEYKATNLPWLPQIPAHWNLVKIRELFTERNQKVSDKDYAPLSVSKGGVVPQISTVAKTDNGDNRKLVKVGDFVINSRSDRKGSSGISAYDGSVSLINLVLKPRNDYNRGYLHYLLKSIPFIEEYYKNGRGIVADLWTTRYSEMKTISIPTPSADEQEQIVRYLDSMTAKINKLIRAKKKQIALLQEQKQNIISTAMTYNPKSSMSIWKKMRLKHTTNVPLQYGANAVGIPFDENEIRYIRITDIDAHGNLKDTDKQSLPQDIGKEYDLKDGDILFARCGGTVGKTYLYRSDDGICCYAGYLIRYRPNKEIVLPDYIYLYTQ